MNYYLGIDIGGTNVKYGVLDSRTNILEEGLTKTPEKGDNIIAFIEEIFLKYKDQYGLLGVGVSVPGIVKDGYLETAGAITDFYNYNLVKVLKDRLQTNVSVENDANCALLAEQWNGEAKDKNNVISYVVGTGIGGSMLLNGDLYYGNNFKAGELGFEIINNPFLTNAKDASITMQYSVATGLVQKYYNETGKYMNGKEIYELSENKDEVALKLIDDFEKNIAISIYNKMILLDPEVVLIGGAVSKNDKFIDSLNNYVNQMKLSHTELRNVRFPMIKANRFYNSSGIIGSVYSLIRKEGL